MAEDEDPDEAEEDGEEDEEGSSGGGKKLIVVIGVALLLVVGGLAAAWFTGLLDPVMNMVAGGSSEASAEGAEGGDGRVDPEAGVFVEVPEVVVNLSTTGRKPAVLRISIMLELDDESDKARIEEVMPRILDNFQVYLRELRIDDMKGSAGMHRLRAELLRRVKAAAAPVNVRSILFKKMLVS